MIKGYKEEVLKNLGVYELRELARNVGVSSPTTKKRKQLEQEILKISKGELLPQSKKTNKGRPPKSIKKVENVLDVFVPKELLEIKLTKKEDEKINEILRFNSNSDYDFEKYDVSGFVRKTVSGYLYFKINGIVDECVSIPLEVANQYSIMQGDKIVGKARKSPSENYYVLEEITLLNDDSPVANRNLEDIEQIVLRDVPIKNLEGVYEGNNVLFINETLKDGVLKIKELIKPLENTYKIVVVASNITTYTKLLIEQNLKAEVICSLIEDHPALAYETSLNAINHVDMLLREGKKVILVVFDIFSLLNGIETFFDLENQRQTHQEHIEATRIVKKLFNYGKVLENNASVTVLSNCLMHETEDQFYKNELIKNADKILRI